MGSSPSPPPVPQFVEPPPPPTPADPSVRQARQSARTRAGQNAGRNATILTSPQGVVRPPDLATQQLSAISGAVGKRLLGE